jgi:Prenyltransferase and squalene oxidase repeat
VRWLPAAAAVLAALVVVAPPEPAKAATNSSAAWLQHARNADGGWGVMPGQPSNGAYTGWAALGLAASGVNPQDAGATRWLEAHPAQPDLGAVTRTVLVMRAAGLPPRLGSRDLADAIVRAQGRSGAWQGRVNTTSFAVLALRAAGGAPAGVRRGADWLVGQANDDGGFNFAGRGGPSGVDDTGAALQALAAAGRGRTRVAARAAAWLTAQRNRDGGFPLVPGGPSNSQSTAWAIQGLLAAGRSPGAAPFAYLRRMTLASGEIRYSASSRQTPVWVTGQALMALARKPLPLAPVAHRRAQPAPRATPRPTATARPQATATVPAATATPRSHRTSSPERHERRKSNRIAAGALLAAEAPGLARAAGLTTGTVVAVLAGGPEL